MINKTAVRYKRRGKLIIEQHATSGTYINGYFKASAEENDFEVLPKTF
jgi:hypothetical protein